MEGYKDTDIILKTLWDEPGCGKVFFYVIDETEHEDVGYGYDTFHSKIERDSHCESVIKGIVGLAEALNLSFRQEGEYIYLEEV
jgi:hypothetical protein